MRRLVLLSLPFVAAGGLAACAPTSTTDDASAAQRQCFQPSQVSNFRADQQTVYVRAGHSAVYAMQTAGACTDLDSAYEVAFVPLMGASSLCTGDRAEIVQRGSTRPSTCRVHIVNRLTEAEVAALPSRVRP